MSSPVGGDIFRFGFRSEEHTSELQSRENLVCRLLLERQKKPQPARPRPPSGGAVERRGRRSRHRARQITRTPATGPRRISRRPRKSAFFFFNDTATTEIYTLSLHDALPI